jgi:hypothetical protein
MTLPLLTRITDLSGPEERFRLWKITDTHLGNRATAETALDTAVREIAADDHAYWIAGGDKGEYINHTDRRFDPKELASWIEIEDLGNLAKRQADRFLEITRPIWSQCLFSEDGNHEDKIYSGYHFDVGAVTAAAMGVPHCRSGAWLRWTFRRSYTKSRKVETVINVVSLHGWGGGRTKGSLANMLMQALAAFGADLVLIGHRHARMRVASLSYVATQTDITTRMRVAACCGGFLNGARYAIEKGYEPAEIGPVYASITPGIHKIEVTL